MKKKSDAQKIIDNKILSDKLMIPWLSAVDNSYSGNTKNLYNTIMLDYYDTVKLLPSELIDLAEKESTLPSRQQTVVMHLSEYKDRLKRLAPTSRVTYLAAIASFYSYYDISLPKKLIAYSDKPTIQNENKLMDNLIDILPIAFKQSDDLMKLIIAIQFTSGLAMSDVISIKVKQFKENVKDNIICLNFKRQKTKIDFHTFVSPTTKKLADAYINKLGLEDNDYLVCEKKGKQMDDKHYMYLFRRLSQNIITGIKNDKGILIKGMVHEIGFFNKFHSHNLRKLFYNSIIKIGGFGIGELAEYFMGHIIPASRAAYFEADVDKLREEYAKFVLYFEEVLNGY